MDINDVKDFHSSFLSRSEISEKTVIEVSENKPVLTEPRIEGYQRKHEVSIGVAIVNDF